ncbi:hypothetical protein YC2023_108977 [Brassica napus]
MASYAPLFLNTNNRRWKTDAVGFNSSHQYGTPSYRSPREICLLLSQLQSPGKTISKITYAERYARKRRLCHTKSLLDRAAEDLTIVCMYPRNTVISVKLMAPVESATTFLQKKWHINKRSLDKQSSITRVIIIHDK